MKKFALFFMTMLPWAALGAKDKPKVVGSALHYENYTKLGSVDIYMTRSNDKSSLIEYQDWGGKIYFSRRLFGPETYTRAFGPANVRRLDRDLQPDELMNVPEQHKAMMEQIELMWARFVMLFIATNSDLNDFIGELNSIDNDRWRILHKIKENDKKMAAWLEDIITPCNKIIVKAGDRRSEYHVKYCLGFGSCKSYLTLGNTVLAAPKRMRVMSCLRTLPETITVPTLAHFSDKPAPANPLLSFVTSTFSDVKKKLTRPEYHILALPEELLVRVFMESWWGGQYLWRFRLINKPLSSLFEPSRVIRHVNEIDIPTVLIELCPYQWHIFDGFTKCKEANIGKAPDQTLTVSIIYGLRPFQGFSDADKMFLLLAILPRHEYASQRLMLVLAPMTKNKTHVPQLLVREYLRAAPVLDLEQVIGLLSLLYYEGQTSQLAIFGLEALYTLRLKDMGFKRPKEMKAAADWQQYVANIHLSLT